MPYYDNERHLQDRTGKGPKAKPKFEERYIRQTYFIHKEIAEYIAAQSLFWSKGEKTRHVNQALKEYFRLEINLESYEKEK